MKKLELKTKAYEIVKENIKTEIMERGKNEEYN